MLVIDGKKSDSYQDFKERVFSLTQSLAEDDSFSQVKVVMTDIRPPKISIIPFSKKKIAVVSVYSNLGQLPGQFLKIDNLTGAYKVTEALPVAYKKDWKDGMATTGVNLLTLFRKKPGIDYDLFLDLWHNGHTPLSLKIHPLWNYNRNVVEESLKNEAPNYDGIVEEQVREASHLLNPFKFFGNPLMIIPNMIRVYLDVKGFIDYPSIETYLANEYWIKS